MPGFAVQQNLQILLRISAGMSECGAAVADYVAAVLRSQQEGELRLITANRIERVSASWNDAGEALRDVVKAVQAEQSPGPALERIEAHLDNIRETLRGTFA